MPLRAHNGDYARVNAPLNLNIFVLVSAYFGNNYGESLKFLSSAMAFFQAKPVFSARDAPEFPRGLEKLSLEMVNLNFQDLSHLWGNLVNQFP